MENGNLSVEPSGNKSNKTKAGLTPRELIHYHINNPDEPISDEDIENLVLDTNAAPAVEDKPVDTKSGAADNRMLNDKEIKQVEDNAVTTPYDILGR